MKFLKKILNRSHLQIDTNTTVQNIPKIKFKLNNNQISQYRSWKNSIIEKVGTSESDTIGGDTTIMFKFNQNIVQSFIFYGEYQMELTQYSHGNCSEPSMDKEFSFDENEQVTFEKWIFKEKLPISVIDEFEFYFTPTTIDTIKVVRYAPKKLEIDVTDYDHW